MSNETKPLFKMVYNWYGHIEEDWGRAANSDQAFRLACCRIAVAKQRTVSSVKQYLNKPHKHEIVEVKE